MLSVVFNNGMIWQTNQYHSGEGDADWGGKWLKHQVLTKLWQF